MATIRIFSNGPPNAHEFIIWSVCTNPGADPRHNVWSGIHTRLSAEIISRSQQVDGMLIWDMVCGTVGRPCPKINGHDDPRVTSLGPYHLPPPCIYLLPATIPSPRNNPNPPPQALKDVEILKLSPTAFTRTTMILTMSISLCPMRARRQSDQPALRATALCRTTQA